MIYTCGYTDYSAVVTPFEYNNISFYRSSISLTTCEVVDESDVYLITGEWEKMRRNTGKEVLIDRLELWIELDGDFYVWKGWDVR